MPSGCFDHGARAGEVAEEWEDFNQNGVLMSRTSRYIMIYRFDSIWKSRTSRYIMIYRLYPVYPAI